MERAACVFPSVCIAELPAAHTELIVEPRPLALPKTLRLIELAPLFGCFVNA